MLKMPVMILDLDNTIYPVESIGEELFKPLFDLLQKPESGLSAEVFKAARADIMRLPFQKVAKKYNFPVATTQKSIDLLRESSYDKPMAAFDGYRELRVFQATKFLVTSGFSKLQRSKLTGLGIENDFHGIYILDPEATEKTKQDVFGEILELYSLDPDRVYVIGDDPESEIRAGLRLGINTILIDPKSAFDRSASTFKVKDLREALNYIR